MTRDEIMKMPVGREIDLLVAEKVMKSKFFGFHPSTNISDAHVVLDKIFPE